MIEDKKLWNACKEECYTNIVDEGLKNIKWGDLDTLTRLLYDYKLTLYKMNTK